MSNSPKVRVRLTRAANTTKYLAATGQIVELDIEEYLEGVVSAEIGNSHLEACKAQAVSARSFAMRIMKSNGYIRDTSADQAFIATYIGDEKRFGNAIRGVRETRGEVLTYDGHLLLYSPYGASNRGKTRKYKNYPYLIETDDPWDSAETEARLAQGLSINVGNRYGLSQYGARYAARTGHNYRQILDFYYPNTEITTGYLTGSVKPREGGVPELAKRKLNDKEKAIIAWAEQRVGNGYVWGATGQILTEPILADLARRHGANVNFEVAKKWLGRRVYDCASLVSRALETMGLRIPTGASSSWKSLNWEIRGTIDTMPDDIVVVLFRESPESNPMRHTGLSITNGEFIDARGHASGVVKGKIGSFPWTHWALPKGLLSVAEADTLRKKISEKENVPMIGKVKVIGKNLALRRERVVADRTLITRIKNGTILDLLERTDAKWFQVKTPTGQVGYVMAEYVELVSEPPLVPPPVQTPDGKFEVRFQFASKADLDVFVKAITGMTIIPL